MTAVIVYDWHAEFPEWLGAGFILLMVAYLVTIVWMSRRK